LTLYIKIYTITDNKIEKMENKYSENKLPENKSSENKLLGFYTSDQFWFHSNQNWEGYHDGELKSGLQPGVGPYEIFIQSS